MPLYEYKCVKCHKVTEKIEKVDGPHLKKCPHCGGKVEKIGIALGDSVQGCGLVRDGLRGEEACAERAEAEQVVRTRPRRKKPTTKETSAARDSKESKDSKETKESKSAAEKKTEKKKN